MHTYCSIALAGWARPVAKKGVKLLTNTQWPQYPYYLLMPDCQWNVTAIQCGLDQCL